MKDLFLTNPQIFFVDLGGKIGFFVNPIESNTRQASALNETYFIGVYEKFPFNLCKIFNIP